MNIEQARFNMVEQQIRPWDVLDSLVLDLLFEVRREDFVPAAWRGLAFADLEIPLSKDQRLLSPKMEARLVQELKLEPSDRVLVIGVGNGYIPALMSKLCQSVTGVEPNAEVAKDTQAQLQHLGFQVNITQGNAAEDWSEGAPWNAILITGSLPEAPAGLLERLAPGGRLVAVIGDAPVMHAMRFTRHAAGLERESLFETVIPTLPNARQPERFAF